jgi:hypothetical protein
MEERRWQAEDDEEELAARGREMAEEPDETEDMADGAADALADMEAHEQRRDQYYSTGGDDQSPGVDTDMNANAPKEQDMPRKRRNGSRGQSDWR